MTTDRKPTALGLTAATIREREALTLIRQVRAGVAALSSAERLTAALHVLRQNGARYKKAAVEGGQGLVVMRVTVSKEAAETTHHTVLALSDNDIDETLSAVRAAVYRQSVDYDFLEDT